MRIIDLSQAHENDMTQFPGSPPVDIKQICNYDPDGFRLTNIYEKRCILSAVPILITNPEGGISRTYGIMEMRDI